MTWGAFGRPAIAACTSSSETAHTSHSSCVITRSGRARSSAAASTSYSGSPLLISSETSRSISALPSRSESILLVTTLGLARASSG